MNNLTIRAFKAVDEPETCAQFIAQHRKVLEDFGIAHVNTNTDSWVTDPDVYVIIAEAPGQGMVGGLRLELANDLRRLPMVEALEKLDGRIGRSVSKWAEGGCAEICGLWNSNQYAGRGLPTLLGYAAVAIANQVGVRSLVCLIAHYTLRHALRVGFTIMEDIGEEGTFTYPIPSIKAIALVMPDAILLNHAQNRHRLPVLSLRMRPNQVRIEQPAHEPIMVHYALQLDSLLIDMAAYQELNDYRLKYTA
jgi:hypothetical protein